MEKAPRNSRGGGHHAGVTGNMMQAVNTGALMELGRDSAGAHRPVVIFSLEGRSGWKTSDDAPGMSSVAPARSRW